MNSFMLQPETLASFRQLVDYTISKCSLFQYGESAGLNEEQIQGLIRQNILDANGQICDDKAHAIKTIGTADRFTRIRFAGSGTVFEYINYYSRITEAYASVTNKKDGFLVEQPVNPDEMIEGIQQLMGQSVLKSFEFETQLPELEAYVLMGIIDLNRQQRIEVLLNSSESELLRFGPEGVLIWTQNVPNDAQWFSSLLKDQLNAEYTLTLSQFQTIFDTLETKGLIEKQGTDYLLANQSIGFSNQFLFTENLISVSMGQEEGEDVFRSGFMVVQAGVNDLLFIDSRDGEVQLEVLSSARLMEYLNQFVKEIGEISIKPEEPTYVLNLEKEIPESTSDLEEQLETKGGVLPSVAMGASLFCIECGTKLSADQKFCHQCGTSTEPINNQKKCPQCQSEVSDEMVFCTSCGQKLNSV